MASRPQRFFHSLGPVIPEFLQDQVAWLRAGIAIRSGRRRYLVRRSGHIAPRRRRCGLPSTSSVRRPSCTSAIARFTAIVVVPTPPLPPTNASSVGASSRRHARAGHSLMHQLSQVKCLIRHVSDHRGDRRTKGLAIVGTQNRLGNATRVRHFDIVRHVLTIGQITQWQPRAAQRRSKCPRPLASSSFVRIRADVPADANRSAVLIRLALLAALESTRCTSSAPPRPKARRSSRILTSSRGLRPAVSRSTRSRCDKRSTALASRVAC